MPVYALLSLIGDKLNIVIRRYQTGSNLNQNLQQTIPIDSPVFDNTAAAAAGRSVQRAQPHAELAILNARSAVLFEKQRQLFEDRGASIGIPEAIVAAAKQQGANRIVMVLRHRAEADFLFARAGTFADGGKLEGLGFYLDGNMKVDSFDDASGKRVASGTGFIAPYAYIEVIIADIASLRVMGRRAITASRVVGSGQPGQEIDQPWNALSSADKVRHVNQIIEREVGKATLELVTALK